MGHLKSCRDWRQAEHLAKFLLWKFCFTSEPSTVADDSWVDLFCNIFHIRTIRKTKQLFPTTPFAIQLKSHMTENKFLVKDNKALNGLKIPYFIGKVDVKKSKVTLYWWEGIKHFYHLKGENIKEKVYIKCVNVLPINENNLKFFESESNKWEYTIFFEKIIEIEINFDYEKWENKEKIKEFEKYCNILQNSIASIQNHQYRLECSKWNPTLISWRVSYQHFRDNFTKRLSEVFGNLERWYRHASNNKAMKKSIQNELNIYKEIKDKLISYYKLNNITKTKKEGDNINLYLEDI